MKWFHKHKGHVVKVEVLEMTAKSKMYAHLAGSWTRPIARCTDCGEIFVAAQVPGVWTVDELNKR